MAIEKLSVILELVSGDYKREAKEAATATGRIGDSAKTTTGSLGRMIGPAAIGGAIVGLTRLAEKAGENADRLFDLSAQTGLSTDALQEWEFVAAAAGAKSEAFSDAVKAIVKNLSEAADGTGASAKAYDTLGISVLDTTGKLRDAGSITDEVFEKLAGMTNITERNALAQDIFGKKWEETISILDLGTDALSDLREEGKKAVVSTEALRNADKFRETMDKLKATLGAQLNRAIGAIAPLLTDVAEAAKDIMDELEPLLEGLGWLSEKFGDAKEAGNEMAESSNPILAGWGRMIGEIGILNILTGNYGDAIEAAITPTREAAEAAIFMADATKDDLIPAVLEAVTPIDRLSTAQRLAGDATRHHFDALVNLANFLASRINPVLAARDALVNLADAQTAARDAANEHGRESEEFAEKQIELALAVAQAEAAFGTFGVNAEDSIDAVATALGVSNEVARTYLDTLGLLDGMEVTSTIILRQINLLEQGVIPEGMGLSSGTTTTRIGGKATGGRVWGGQPYVVGEAGQELFIPGTAGSIVSNKQLMAALGRPNVTGGSVTVINPVTRQMDLDLQYAALLANHATFGKF
ncbi:MAG TPA: hypothetical protein VJQ79_01880 [Acidimicrobiia bacterium]|nr:hypothetical protein [Acidimicrobiia bacterium]